MFCIFTKYSMSTSDTYFTEGFRFIIIILFYFRFRTKHLYKYWEFERKREKDLVCVYLSSWERGYLTVHISLQRGDTYPLSFLSFSDLMTPPLIYRCNQVLRIERLIIYPVYSTIKKYCEKRIQKTIYVCLSRKFLSLYCTYITRFTLTFTTPYDTAMLKVYWLLYYLKFFTGEGVHQ